jgi:cell division ATPase FtsA
LGQKLGLTLKGVNYSGYELYNFLDYEIGIMHETYLAIDFGARNTNAIVIADGVLKFNKLIPKGLEQITQYLCEELNCNVSRAEQLKRQYNVLNAREGLSPESEEYVVAKYTKRGLV